MPMSIPPSFTHPLPSISTPRPSLVLIEVLTQLTHRKRSWPKWLFGEHKVWDSQTLGQHEDNAKPVPGTHTPIPGPTARPQMTPRPPPRPHHSPLSQGWRHLRLRQPRQTAAELPPSALPCFSPPRLAEEEEFTATVVAQQLGGAQMWESPEDRIVLHSNGLPASP